MDDKELRSAALLPAIASSYKPSAADPLLCTEQRIHPAEDPSSESVFVFDCRHPGCGKTFHSSDAVRKHARKQHVHWLRRIDEEASLTRLMHRTEQYSAKRIVSRSEHEAAAAAQHAADSDWSDDELQDREAAFAAPDPKRTLHACLLYTSPSPRD